MGWNEDANRRRMLRRFLQLWNMIPDDTFAHVIAQVFKLKSVTLESTSDEEAFARINDVIEGKTSEIYQTKLHMSPPPLADNICAWMDFSPDAYTKAHLFLDELKQYTNILSRGDYANIKRIALCGNLDMAKDELAKIVQENESVKEMEAKRKGRR